MFNVNILGGLISSLLLFGTIAAGDIRQSAAPKAEERDNTSTAPPSRTVPEEKREALHLSTATKTQMDQCDHDTELANETFIRNLKKSFAINIELNAELAKEVKKLTGIRSAAMNREGSVATDTCGGRYFSAGKVENREQDPNSGSTKVQRDECEHDRKLAFESSERKRKELRDRTGKLFEQAAKVVRELPCMTDVSVDEEGFWFTDRFGFHGGSRFDEATHGLH